MVKTNWHKIGEEGEKESKKRAAAAKQRRLEGYGPMRFRLENDSATKIIFLDTPKFYYDEHTVMLGPKQFENFTCIATIDTCPACEDGNRPSWVLAGTIISTKQWKDRDDKVHQYDKMLFIAKGTAQENLLRRIKAKDGDIRMCLFEVARGSNKREPATGQDFQDLNKKVTAKSLVAAIEKHNAKGENEVFVIKPEGGKFSEHLKPYDYATLLAPKSLKEILELMGKEKPVGSDSDEDEDIEAIVSEADNDPDSGDGDLDLDDLDDDVF